MAKSKNPIPEGYSLFEFLRTMALGSVRKRPSLGVFLTALSCPEWPTRPMFVA